MTEMLHYLVYQATPFGAVSIAAELDAPSDSEALRQARIILPDGPGELRENGRVVCRFGRSRSFLLQT